MKKAPILVYVYDRPDHFKACVDSLAQNPEASDTVLFISSDGPKDDQSRIKVDAVRDYIATISGFKRVILFAPSENSQGLVKLEALDAVKNDFSRYIKTEDDNVFSPFALNYFNEGLELYEDNPLVHAICGYNYPGFPAKAHSQVFLRCVAVWGIALWRGKDLPTNFDQISLAEEALINPRLFGRINQCLPHVPFMNIEIVEGRLRAGDVTRCNYIFKHGLVCVFPSVSLVRNIGNDGSGVHCGVNPILTFQTISLKPISYETTLPLTPTKQDERWISWFLGGAYRRIGNWLLHFSIATRNNYLAAFLKTSYLIHARLYSLGRRFSLVFGSKCG